MNNFEKQKLLTIYFDRETGKYSSFNVIYLNEKLTREKVETLAENWNKNPEQKTKVKIYDDKLLLDLCGDLTYTITFKRFLDDMHDLLENIQDYSRNLSYEAESIQDFLKENFSTQEDS